MSAGAAEDGEEGAVMVFARPPDNRASTDGLIAVLNGGNVHQCCLTAKSASEDKHEITSFGGYADIAIISTPPMARND